ncbi:metal-dependent hydrolase [Salibacterium salarium]|uniref:Metal-dependent hydrolase n=1 Tax=Salibacterium salarium TaxID=284579 RepID=A0A3R9WLG3_9BACI|nr:metal-dependent hydrolase [Salibacterium salarium]RSL28926.1 metal-dependent hydrolase [Salibacterium salarium]
MDYIIHTLLHFLVGASISYLIINKEDRTKSKRFFIMIFGGAVAVSPDVTKFFGDLWWHSIWFVLVSGLLFAIVFRWFTKNIVLQKLWFTFSLTVLVGHILIDYLGNGVAFLYPFVKEEFEFHIVYGMDVLIIFVLLLALSIGVFYSKGKRFVIMGVLIVTLYLMGLGFSKIQLEQALENQYQRESIDLLLTYPESLSQWSFQVRTDEVWYSGYSPVLNQEIFIETKRKVN